MRKQFKIGFLQQGFICYSEILKRELLQKNENTASDSFHDTIGWGR
jgi:hypothetical protein